jgi:hypothetical protein
MFHSYQKSLSLIGQLLPVMSLWNRELMLGDIQGNSWVCDTYISILSREGIKFTNIRQPMLKLKTHSDFRDLFDTDMSNNTNTVVYFDWKMVIYIYVCRKCRTQFMLPMKKSVTFTGSCANEIIPLK